MSARLYRDGLTMPRGHGLSPHTLQRVLELEAALQVFTARCAVQDVMYWRRRVAAMPLRELHGAVARILTHIPARRLL